MAPASKHALLAPSSSKRWINCPPSARLEAKYPNKSSAAADEGTLAHELGEHMINKGLGRMSAKEFSKRAQIIKENPLYAPEMWEHSQNYADTVLSAGGQGSFYFIEKVVDFSRWVKGGKGTTDASVISPIAASLSVDKAQVTYLLDFYDLKYGKGVHVPAEDNEQLKCYALGLLEDYGYMYNITHVRLNIIQPRHELGSSSFEISVTELYKWADEVLRPAAELAWKGEGELKTGDHCKFCKAMAPCSARAELTAQAMKADFSKPKELTDKQILEVYKKLHLITDWAKSVNDYILGMALSGKNWPGYKLVEGKSNRIFKDEKRTEKLLLADDYTDIYTPVKLLGITELQKRIGNHAFKNIVERGLTKPKGAPTLVPLSDKRREYNNIQSDFKDFKPDEPDYLS